MTRTFVSACIFFIEISIGDTTETIELGRKAAIPAASAVEGMDISALPSVKDITLLKPQATYNNMTISLVDAGHMTNTESYVKAEPKSSSSKTQRTLNITQTVETNKAPSISVTKSFQVRYIDLDSSFWTSSAQISEIYCAFKMML